MEIRLHGRGGQGGVTCAKILAGLYADTGKSVQTFGDYAGERSGAPIRAFTRVSDEQVTNRNKVYEPDHVMVLDPSLLDASAVAGLAVGGTLIVNTVEPAASLAARYPAFRVATVDATAIARRHGIGTRSVVIVNTTIAGAFARVMGLPLQLLEATYDHLGFGANLAAAREAYNAVVTEGPRAGNAAPKPTAAIVSPPAVMDLVDQREGAVPTLKTGSWRSQLPRYVRSLAPCSARCPAGNDVVGFVQALARKNETEAAAVLGRTTPFASICGRVCPGFCMQGCNRIEFDDAVNTRAVERWIGDHATVASRSDDKPLKTRRIAIVGGGPAGLSAAYQLARMGHQAVIFDSEPELGGMLRYGIPAYRLPRELLARDVQSILALGVEARCGAALHREDIKRLSADYDAVILATGLQELTGIETPGATLDGIHQGLPFLHDAEATEDRLSGHVVVVGGGNTAMDCARSALRLGARRVTVCYRRTREEMPAIPEEVREAESEGVRFRFQRAPVGFRGKTKLTGIFLADVEMGEPDTKGRRRPVVTDRVRALACNTVLLALGQSPDQKLLPEGWRIVEGRAFEGERALNVFASGDLATNEGTVAHAIGHGRRIAGQALVELGESVDVFMPPDTGRAVKPSQIRFDHFEHVAPKPLKHPLNGKRPHDFSEVNGGLFDASEAARCLSCGDCTECDTCLVYCPEGIISRTAGGGYSIDENQCKGCGLCVAECPRVGMEMVTP